MAKGDTPKSSVAAGKKQGQDERANHLGLDERHQHLKTQLAKKNVLVKTDSDEEHRETSNEASKGMAQAVKISSEFLAGVVVGVVLGLGFDQLLGTSPWGLIVFLFLGFAAGVLNILRSTGRVKPSNIGKHGISNHAKADSANLKGDKGA